MAMFEKIFTLTVTHTYFKSGVTPDIRIWPDQPTRQLITNNRLLLRNQNGTTFVAAEAIKRENNSQDLFLKHPLPVHTVFRFFVELNNPDLMNITRFSVPYSSGYIMELGNRTAAEHNGNVLLHQTGGAHTAPIMPLQTQVNTEFSIPAAMEQNHAELKNGDGSILKKIKTIPNNEGVHHFGLNLLGVAPGFYEIWFDNKKYRRFYWPGRDFRGVAHGIIEIDCSTGLPGLFRVFEDAPAVADGEYDTLKINSPEFTVAFNNLETIWRYHVTSRQENGLTGSSIQSDSYLFTETAAENGKKKIFESNSPIPLRENGVKGIRLKKTENGSERVLIENLPGANFKLVEPDKEAQGTFYSDIYVYI